LTAGGLRMPRRGIPEDKYMASATVAIPDTEREIVTRGWLISQKDDLIWFIGSVISSYLLLIANLKFGVPLMVLVWIWALGFDGPHVFGTVSRTYADRDERRKRAKLFYGTLSLFLVGPLMVLAGRASLLGTSVWGPAFFFFASVWAYYHLVKQHYGFMILYKKKNDDLLDTDNLVDRGFLLLAMTYPFVHFIIHGAASKSVVPFATTSAAFSWFEAIVFDAFLVSLLLFLGRQAQRVFFLKKPLDGPKLLLFAAAIPMHWIVLRFLEPAGAGGVLAAVATLTIYHNIQYHRLIWFHNYNKYTRPGAGKFGLASLINKSFWTYFGFAVLFGAAYHIPHYTIVAPGGLVMSFIWGGAFTHYYLDSKIWRVRRDKQLNHNLRIEATSAPAQSS
jgi:hypothetical protein